MQVADIRASLHAVPTPRHTGAGDQSNGRATRGGRESTIAPDSRETQPDLYGELLPSRSGLAPTPAVDLPRPAGNESVVYASHTTISHLSYQRAIDTYQSLQAHATEQVLSPVYRIDLYA